MFMDHGPEPLHIGWTELGLYFVLKLVEGNVGNTTGVFVSLIYRHVLV